VLRTRLKTAALLLPTLLAIVIFASPVVFSVFVALVTLWGLYEIGAMQTRPGYRWIVLAVCGALSLALLRDSWAPAGSPPITPYLTVLVALAPLLQVVQVGIRGPERFGSAEIYTQGLLVAMLYPYFAYLRNGPEGIAYVILIILLAAATDTGAYFVGRSVGRVKLLPKVSPQKTVEGAVGGLLGSIAAGLILRPWLTPALQLAPMVVLASGAGALAQLGDLDNSALKRIAGVKDSGWLFPGHGGLLDRACSLVFPAVFAYYYLHWAVFTTPS
jgi:phosphatidate cytidylyltransferase